MKDGGVRILQIAIDGGDYDDLPTNLEGNEDGKSNAFIYGLGSDGKVYWWRVRSGEWYLAKKA